MQACHHSRLGRAFHPLLVDLADPLRCKPVIAEEILARGETEPLGQLGLLAFWFLLIPTLTAHLFSHNMPQFTILASLLGGAAALSDFRSPINGISQSGLPISFCWDWPTPRSGSFTVAFMLSET